MGSGRDNHQCIVVVVVPQLESLMGVQSIRNTGTATPVSVLTPFLMSAPSVWAERKKTGGWRAETGLSDERTEDGKGGG